MCINDTGLNVIGIYLFVKLSGNCDDMNILRDKPISSFLSEMVDADLK